MYKKNNGTFFHSALEDIKVVEWGEALLHSFAKRARLLALVYQVSTFLDGIQLPNDQLKILLDYDPRLIKSLGLLGNR